MNTHKCIKWILLGLFLLGFLDLLAKKDFVLEMDTNHLPKGDSLTTDNVETTLFTAARESDCKNDFGFTVNAAPPVADNDTTSTNEDTAVNLDILSNDIDPNGILSEDSINIIALPTMGIVVDNKDSTLTYRPNVNTNGLDSLQYEICDSGSPSLCDTAWVFIEVISVNDSPTSGNEKKIIDEEVTSQTYNLFYNNTDPDEDNLMILPLPTVSTQGGTVSYNAIDTTFTYIPPMDFNGLDTILYTVCDDGSPMECVLDSVFITIIPVNDPPVADEDAVTTPEDTPIIIGVTLGDTDIDGKIDATTVALVDTTSNGEVSIDPITGDITYTPNPNFFGMDTLAYQICDDGSPVLCDTALVVITITNICPTIDSLITDRIICSSSLVDTLAVTTTANNPDRIAFVYFNNQQTDQMVIHHLGTSIDTVQVAAGNDTVQITNIAFPENIGMTPVIYYVYAIYLATLEEETCRPYEEILVIINPQPSISGRDTTVCNGQLVDLSTLISEPPLSTLAYGTTFGTYSGSNSVNPSATTTYFVRDSVNSTSCIDSAAIVITVQNCDWGDLPDASVSTNTNDYQTLSANDGPVHVIIPGLSLGSTVDGETDGQPSIDALGDEIDENGLIIFSSLNLHPGSSFRLPLNYVNTTGSIAHLEAWIDWNGDGAFSMPTEMEVDMDDSRGFPVYLEFTVPVTAKTGSLLGFRIRLSNTDNMTPYGLVNSGEVEDYLLDIDCPQMICLPIETELKKE